MQADKGTRLMSTGAIGGIVTAVCCFTPVLVVLFGALGLGAITGYLDYVLLPAMAIFLGLIVYGRRLKSRCTADSKASRS